MGKEVEESSPPSGRFRRLYRYPLTSVRVMHKVTHP
jgi:hypothetical protein